jgi:hypothetical protein
VKPNNLFSRDPAGRRKQCAAVLAIHCAEVANVRRIEDYDIERVFCERRQPRVAYNVRSGRGVDVQAKAKPREAAE